MSANEPIWKETYPVETTSHVVYHYDTVVTPPTVQIETGVSASGKRTWDINVHAGSVEEALALIDQAEEGLRNRYS